MISPEYLAQLKLLHAERPTFGASGAKIAEDVMALTRIYQTQQILDYGCGKGILREALGFPIQEFDPAIEGKDTPPQPADIVVASDLMEHIEPEFTDAVLDDIARLTQRVAYFLIATRPAKKMLADGRNAHLVVAPMAWWLEKLEARFKRVSVTQDGEREFVFVGERK